MSMHIRSTLRRAVLLANSNSGQTTIINQKAALGHAAPYQKLKPAIEDRNFEKNIISSPHPDCEFHNMTLTQKFFDGATRWPDKIAMECGVSRRRYTYNTMTQAVRRFGSALTRMGFRKGQVMGLVSPNIPEFPIVTYGSAGVGMPVALVNPAYTPDEIARQLNLVGATAVFGVSAMANQLKQVAQLCPSIRKIILFGPTVEGCVSYQELIAQETGDLFNDNLDIDINEDIFLLPHSSGTSGLPKNVMLTHSTVGKNVTQFLYPAATSNRHATDNHQETYICVLPFFHAYGTVAIMLSGLELGAKLVTLPNFEVASYLKAIADSQPTFLHVVPVLVSLLNSLPELKKKDYQNIHSVFCAAAPLGTSSILKFLEKFPNPNVNFLEAYGLTEMSPGALMSPLGNTKLGSCGTLFSRTKAKVMDLETGTKALGPYTNGELVLHGPQIMKGYYKNQKATDEMIGPDGWLRTGDVAYYDEDGAFYIVDRLKELIKVKGFQVAPAELENILLSHPAIKEVAVIGIPDERAGELPRACIVKKPGTESVTDADIQSFVNSKVSAHKRLAGGIEFREAIPRNDVGKILRRELRLQYANARK